MYFAQNKKQKFVRLEYLFNEFNTKNTLNGYC